MAQFYYRVSPYDAETREPVQARPVKDCLFQKLSGIAEQLASGPREANKSSGYGQTEHRRQAERRSGGRLGARARELEWIWIWGGDELCVSRTLVRIRFWRDELGKTAVGRWIIRVGMVAAREGLRINLDDFVGLCPDVAWFDVVDRLGGVGAAL